MSLVPAAWHSRWRSWRNSSVGTPHTAYPLDTFDDHRANVALSQFFPNSLDVVQGDEGALLGVVYRGDDLGVVRYGHSFRRPSVERTGEGHHPIPPGGEGCELMAFSLASAPLLHMKKA